MKLEYLISLRISGPSNIQAFSFFILNSGNDLQIYLKQFPFLSKVLISQDCFIKSSFIWSGGKIILSLSTNGTCMMFAPPTVKFCLKGQFIFFQ